MWMAEEDETFKEVIFLGVAINNPLMTEGGDHEGIALRVWQSTIPCFFQTVLGICKPKADYYITP